MVNPSSAVTTYPKGTPVPTPSIKAQVIEDRVDLSNDMTLRQMIGVGVRRVVLARGELDKLEGPKYAARRAELRREAGEAARARDRQAAVAPQNEAEESGATVLKIDDCAAVASRRPHDADHLGTAAVRFRAAAARFCKTALQRRGFALHPQRETNRLGRKFATPG